MLLMAWSRRNRLKIKTRLSEEAEIPHFFLFPFSAMDFKDTS